MAVAGSGGCCVVCVNGMQQTMAAWRPFLRVFAGDRRYRVVLFDFPAQGRARTIAGPPEISLAEQIEVLSAVVQTASPGSPVALVGGSWGGVIAAAYAAAEPSRVAALILGSFCTSPNERMRELACRGQALIAEGNPDALGAMFVDGFGERMRPAGQQRLRQQFRRLTADQLRQLHFAGQLLLAHDDLNAVIDLSRITARTLIVNGADDPIVDADSATAAAELIGGCEIRVVAGVGHFLHLENPALMNVYKRFFDRDSEQMR